MVEYCCGPLGIRECDGPMDVGHEVEIHNHNYDHVTFIQAGAFRIERLKPVTNADGVVECDENNRPKAFVTEGVRDVYAGLRAMVEVPAYAWHKMTALEPNSRYICVFTHRDAVGNIIQHYDGIVKGMI